MSILVRMKSFSIRQPINQAIAIALAGLLFMLLDALFIKLHFYEKDLLFPWSTAAAFLLFFALVNSLMSLQNHHFAQYWGQSMYSYMGLALVLGMAAWFFSGKTVSEAGSYRWIIFVVTFGFLVFLSMVNFMKKIVQFAEKEEWNQPKKRR
jgi:hypothetical protein